MNTEHNKGFVMNHPCILRSKVFTLTQKALIHHILNFNDNPTGIGCVQSQKRIAEENGIEESNVKKNLKILKSQKIIIIEERKNTTNKMRVDEAALIAHLEKEFPGEIIKLYKSDKQVKKEAKAPSLPNEIGAIIKQPLAKEQAKSNSELLADIKAHVTKAATERGIHPQHKVCVDFVTAFQQKMSRGENLNGYETDLNAVLNKSFPIPA